MFPLHTHFLERLGYPREKPLLRKNRLSPSSSPFPKISDFLGDSALSEGETAFGKNRLSPSDSPFPKTSAFIFLFCQLIQVYTDNKVIDKDKYPYKKPYSKNAKRKSGYTKI